MDLFKNVEEKQLISVNSITISITLAPTMMFLLSHVMGATHSSWNGAGVWCAPGYRLLLIDEVQNDSNLYANMQSKDGAWSIVSVINGQTEDDESILGQSSEIEKKEMLRIYAFQVARGLINISHMLKQQKQQ